MKTGDTVYYLNKPVKFLAEVENEILIELMSGVEHFDEYDSPGYSEPIHTKILVDKKYIRGEAVNIGDDFKKSIKEIAVLKRNELEEIEKLKRDVRKEINAEKYKIENEIKELRKKASKYKGLEQMIEYLDGKFKYVVYTNSEHSWQFGIDELDKLGLDKEKELVSVSFRSKRQIDWRKSDFQMYVGIYSDDSGTKYLVEGFETLEDATNRFLQVCDEKKSFSESEISKCDKLGIVHPKVEARKKELLEIRKNEKLKKIEDAEKELQRLKDGASSDCGHMRPAKF